MKKEESYQLVDNIPIEEEKIREHTIYHIPGVKVGCTVDFKARWHFDKCKLRLLPETPA
jgi:hypothetical protein